MKQKFPFLDSSEEEKIVHAIKEAERNTSGQIRVHIQEYSKKGISDLKAAKRVFVKLNMTNTNLRNGVLFHVATDRKSISIIGDKGIYRSVPKDFWEDVKETILSHFKKEAYAEGLGRGIYMAGQALKEYFPYQEDTINELPDQISKS
ncbi:TPM domain-containing protein [Bacteroidetes bacterium endosymbiont of Geopemphigus sp.]|uniref:TPM domain-containing protein n=1 Tax=Bacteroidetes bacterium endosymbiont of Geopemphigus sp. TaxID=2047937 RepID=UPI000CD01111|nr:TPM domain-containing protein [Bacteroidetes bacterium endosymbiont of Geopemphigus sp.]